MQDRSLAASNAIVTASAALPDAPAPAALAPREPSPHKLEAFVEGGLLGGVIYLRKLYVTTRDQVLHPFAFARGYRSSQYCRPATYLVLALFCEVLLTTTSLSLQKAGPDSMIDRKVTAQLAHDVGTGALTGDWTQVLLGIAPILLLAVMFAAFLQRFARRRYGGDFARAFAITSYSVGASMYLRAALMLLLLPGLASAAGSTPPPALQVAKNVLLPVIAVLQFYPLLPLLIHLREWTGQWRAAVWCWFRAAICTLIVLFAVAVWMYPLWKNVIRLSQQPASVAAPAPAERKPPATAPVAGSRAY